VKLSPEAAAALVAEILAIGGRPGPDGHDAAVLERIAETLAAHHELAPRAGLAAAPASGQPH
jgi:hypothetical protein